MLGEISTGLANQHGEVGVPHGKGVDHTDKRPAGVQLDESRQKASFLSLAPSGRHTSLHASTAPSAPHPCLILRPSARQK